jgi:hypothetical protein
VVARDVPSILKDLHKLIIQQLKILKSKNVWLGNVCGQRDEAGAMIRGVPVEG